jgi:hypothetical protein
MVKSVLFEDNGDHTMTITVKLGEPYSDVTMVVPMDFDQLLTSISPESQQESARLLADGVIIPDSPL